jgi:hypothetical protein
MDGGPSEEEDDSDDSTATEVRDDHTATAYKAFAANPLQRITTTNELFKTHSKGSRRKPANFYGPPVL